MTVRILNGDCRDVLKTLPDESVHCVVTSPPYFGLRDYGVDGQIGLESTPDTFVAELVAVFHEIKRVLRADGTVWLNLGDSYCSTAPGTVVDPGKMAGKHVHTGAYIRSKTPAGLKPKDLIGIPWRVAFALQADGWWLRQDIIWSKPNPMPESVTDRCTKAHEYIFLLSKSERYHYDAEAIREDWTSGRDDMRENGLRTGLAYVEQGHAPSNSVKSGAKKTKVPGGWDIGAGGHGTIHREGRTEAEYVDAELKAGRNKRSVWSIATAPFSEAHFATFPPALIEPCILAGCPEGGTVLDPFFGAGTTGLVADRLGRDCIGIELNPAYSVMASRRIKDDGGMFAEIA